MSFNKCSEIKIRGSLKDDWQNFASPGADICFRNLFSLSARNIFAVSVVYFVKELVTFL